MNKMKNKIIITIMIVMFLVSFTSAAQDSLGTFKQGETITLLQICGTCTYNNITSIVFPNSSHVAYDVAMTKRGMEYTYTFTDTNQVGTYLVNGVGDLDGTANAWAYEFDVTGTGYAFNIQNSVFYLGVLGVLIFLFIICIWGYNVLPNEDPKDFEGKLMDINWLKYLRYPMGIMAWGSLTMIFFLGWNIAEAFLIGGLVAKIFQVLYTINFYSLMIALPIIFFYILVRAIEDNKFKQMIERGVM